MHQILTVWKKEIRDTIRDRRTLLATIIIPMVLMPLLVVGMTKLIEYQMKNLQGQNVAILISGADHSPALAKAIGKQGGIEIVKNEDQKKIEEELKSGLTDGAVIIPQDFEENVKNLKPAEIKLLFKSTNQKTIGLQSKVNMAVSEFNSQILESRFSDQKVNPAILSKVSLANRDLATDKERGGFGLGLLLPVFIVIWAITGGTNTAIDASAGEKERKTLEALLLTPARRINIVFGKFLAVATIATTSVVVSLSSLYLTISNFGFGPVSSSGQINSANAASVPSAAFNLSLDPESAFILLFISFLLVCLFSAMLLSIAIFAKSFKEAQSYLSPMYLVVIMPIVLANTMIGFAPGIWAFAVPGMNAILLFKEVLTGSYVPSHIFVTAGSLILYSLIAIFIATKIYGKENVMFKS